MRRILTTHYWRSKAAKNVIEGPGPLIMFTDEDSIECLPNDRSLNWVWAKNFHFKFKLSFKQLFFLLSQVQLNLTHFFCFVFYIMKNSLLNLLNQGNLIFFIWHPIYSIMYAELTWCQCQLLVYNNYVIFKCT
jgi:hypothetical protein